MSWGIGKRVAALAVAGLAKVKAVAGMGRQDPAGVDVFRKREAERKAEEHRRLMEAHTLSNPFRRLFWPRGKSLQRHGSRECARRRGGLAWQIQRDVDRVRRGLEPIHTVGEG